MRKPLVQRTQRGLRSGIEKAVPAPVGGWNTRDPLAAMKATDARWLENWWPDATGVSLRKGAVSWATGITGFVKTLMRHTSGGVSKLFAVTDSGIYDSTASGAVGASVFTPTEGKLSHTLFTVAGATYLVAVSGVDKMIQYNGSTWQFIDGTTTPAITGVSTDTLDFVALHQRRLWFVQQHSMSLWYLPVNVIGGAATEFPVGQLFKLGGYVISVGTWTIDSGNGADDLFVILTSQGEVAVYKGIDPSSSSSFSLVGMYFIGKSVSARGLVKFGGDLLVLTDTGLYPLSKAMLTADIGKGESLSSKIDSTLSQSVRSYGGNAGWQTFVHSNENALIVNIPLTEYGYSYQVVMNTLTKSWTLFTGWDAYCWEILGGEAYFGGDGFVAKAFQGQNDFGNQIVARAASAFNLFGTGLTKHFKLLRPMLKTSGTIDVSIGLDVDFFDETLYSSLTPAVISGDMWDTGVWDTAQWGGDLVVDNSWMTVFSNPGIYAAVRLQIAAKDVTVQWSSTTLLYNTGGVL